MIRTKDSLAELINSDQYVTYIDGESMYGKHDLWHIYGDLRHDFFWIVITNIKTGDQIIECIQSIVQSPPMKYRDGVEKIDAGLLEKHSNIMWKKYKKKFDD